MESIRLLRKIIAIGIFHLKLLSHLLGQHAQVIPTIATYQLQKKNNNNNNDDNNTKFTINI